MILASTINPYPVFDLVVQDSLLEGEVSVLF